MPPLYHRVWQWLKYNVNHSDNEIPLTDGTTLKIEKGQRLTSIRQIAKGVGWYEGHKWLEPNPKTVKTIINWLKVNRMILVDNGKGNRQYTLVTLTKWDFYQSNEIEGNAEVTAEKQLGNSKETPAGSGTGHKQEGYKKEKNEKKNIYTSEFELFWSSYPESGRELKPQSFKNFTSLIKNKKLLSKDLIQAAKNYSTDCTSLKKTDFLYKASNFVGKAEYYKSYLDGVWVPAKPKQGSSQNQTYSFDKAKQESIIKRQAKADCLKCKGAGKIKLLDHFTNETIEITCECCKINQ
jgi:hypothetical protein